MALVSCAGAINSCPHAWQASARGWWAAVALLPAGTAGLRTVTSPAAPAISLGLACDKPRWGTHVFWSSTRPQEKAMGAQRVRSPELGPPPWLPHGLIINVNQLVVWVTWDF